MKKEMIDKKSATMFWVLMAIYVALFVVLAINPVNRPIWFAENVVVWIVLGVVLGLYWRGVRFSRMAYVLIFVPLYLHTIGGHWTYAHVPFGWVTDHFGSTRNNFDKVAHFTVGFYAYPVAEWIWESKMVTHPFLLVTYPVFAIATVAMSYEVIEWAYAALSSSTVSDAYLANQGDIWDAQKDMLADALGALVTIAIFYAVRKPKLP